MFYENWNGLFDIRELPFEQRNATNIWRKDKLEKWISIRLESYDKYYFIHKLGKTMINKINYIVVWILSFIAFFVVIIPIATLLRILRFDLLRKRLYKTKSSYWINSNKS